MEFLGLLLIAAPLWFFAYRELFPVHVQMVEPPMVEPPIPMVEPPVIEPMPMPFIPEPVIERLPLVPPLAVKPEPFFSKSVPVSRIAHLKDGEWVPGDFVREGSARHAEVMATKGMGIIDASGNVQEGG